MRALRSAISGLRSLSGARPDTLRIGAWGLGNSLLIPAYGVFAILVVFRATPEEELAAYLVLQAIYLMVVQLARSFGYTPLIRHFFDTSRRGETVGSGATLTVMFHIIVLGGLLLGRDEVAGVLSCPPLRELIWPVAAAVVLGVPAELRIAILQALHRTREVFLINATYHATMITVITISVVMHGSVHAARLIEASVAAATSSSIVSLFLAPRGFFHPRLTRSALKRLYDYGRFTLGTSLSGVVFTRIDVLILSSFRPPAEVAAYGVSKVFARIFDIYLHTAALVLFPLFCRLWSERRRQELRDAYRRLLVGSNVLFVGLVAGLVVVAIPMVRLFYGDKYPSAGPLLIAFSLTGLTIPWMTLAQNLINAAGIPSYVFGTRIAIAGLNLLLDLVLIHLFGAFGAIAATLVSFTLLAVFMTRKATHVFGMEVPSDQHGYGR